MSRSGDRLVREILATGGNPAKMVAVAERMKRRERIRVIALRSAVRAMTNVDSGNLGNYIGVSALKPFINSDLILGEFLELGPRGPYKKKTPVDGRA